MHDCCTTPSQNMHSSFMHTRSPFQALMLTNTQNQNSTASGNEGCGIFLQFMQLLQSNTQYFCVVKQEEASRVGTTRYYS